MRPSHRRILAATIAALMEGKNEHTATPRELAHALRRRERDVLQGLRALQAEDLAAPVAGGRWWKLLPKAEQALAEGRRQLEAEALRRGQARGISDALHVVATEKAQGARA